MKVTAAVTLYGMSDPAAEGCGVNPGLLVPEILSVPRIPFLWGLLYLVLVTQSCLTLCDPLDCSPPGSSIHGIFQARILEQVAISFARGIFLTRDRTHVSCVSCIAGRFLIH